MPRLGPIRPSELRSKHPWKPPHSLPVKVEVVLVEAEGLVDQGELVVVLGELVVDQVEVVVVVATDSSDL